MGKREQGSSGTAGPLWCPGFTDAANLDKGKGGSSGPGEKGPGEDLFRVESTGFCIGWVWWSMVERVKEGQSFSPVTGSGRYSGCRGIGTDVTCPGGDFGEAVGPVTPRLSGEDWAGALEFGV